MTDRKKLEKYLIIGAIAIFAIVSVTYAFFQAQLDDGASTNVNLDTGTTDSLTFDVGDDISLSINQFNFGVGAGNLTSNTTASATLLANNASNTATYNYYVYFRINSNEFIYTTSDSKPEIILTVTDPTGQPVTSIDGLTYVQNIQTTTSDGSTQTVSGFDITTATGTFAVASAYSITADSTTPTTQNWEFTATFINLDSDQQGNTGKEMDAEIIIQQNELKPTLADYVISQYTGTDGENGLYYHDADLANGAQDNSYRYSGANPNNYICFGATGADCQNSENQYRIIGVFNNQVKLIKATSYGDYAWDADNVNTWDASTKPDIYTTLNTTYYNTLGNEWQNKIADATWKVGGFPDTYLRDSLKANYDYEVGANQTGYEETMKIGLMYVSDYVYASSSNNWTATLYDYGESTDPNEGWLYFGAPEWTISCNSSNSNSAWDVSSDGDLFSGLSVHYAYAVRPSFYLSSSVNYVSGSGTSADPIVIN